jgi:hypothetical protein
MIENDVGDMITGRFQTNVVGIRVIIDILITANKVILEAMYNKNSASITLLALFCSGTGQFMYAISVSVGFLWTALILLLHRH